MVINAKRVYEYNPSRRKIESSIERNERKRKRQDGLGGFFHPDGQIASFLPSSSFLEPLVFAFGHGLGLSRARILQPLAGHF